MAKKRPVEYCHGCVHRLNGECELGCDEKDCKRRGYKDAQLRHRTLSIGHWYKQAVGLESVDDNFHRH